MVNESERALSALNFLDAGCSREEWVRIGMAAKSSGLVFEDFHGWSANAGNYKDRKSCLSVWKSFDIAGGVTQGTLYGMAKAKGWVDPNKSKWISTAHKVEKTPKKPAKKMFNQAPGESVVEVWKLCTQAASDEEYIRRKQGTAIGLRVYPPDAPPLVIRKQNVAGYLVVPCFCDDELQTLQFIPPNGGDKLNLPRAFFNNGFFVVGEMSEKIYVCEGIGQAWAVNKSSGAAAVVCFGAGRMMTVAQVLREKYPAAHLVIVPDRGKEKQAAEIAVAVDAHWVEIPNDKPSNYDVNDYAQEYGSHELAVLLACAKASEMRYKLLSSADLLNAPPMRWLVRGVIPAKGLAAIYGPSGSGKSFLILDMAFAIAAGDKYWFGLRVSQAPVTYICLEGEVGMGKRVKAWGVHCNRELPTALKFITQPFNLLGDDVPELGRAVIATGGAGGLVIVDTLNRAAPGADENSSQDMGNIIAACNQLQILTGGVVMPVHHTGKDSTKGLRGHSSLYAALDGAIEVIKTDTRREWSVAKSKDDVTGNAHSFRLEIVPVGIDEEGGDITSCVALFDDSKGVLQMKKPSLGRNQKIALEEIDRQLIGSSHAGKEDVLGLSKRLSFDEVVLLVAQG
jgi:putative DNA primase/helicase